MNEHIISIVQLCITILTALLIPLTKHYFGFARRMNNAIDAYRNVESFIVEASKNDSLNDEDLNELKNIKTKLKNEACGAIVAYSDRGWRAVGLIFSALFVITLILYTIYKIISIFGIYNLSRYCAIVPIFWTFYIILLLIMIRFAVKQHKSNKRS